MKDRVKLERCTASPNITEIVTSDLRALLFWASIGIAKSQGGSYQEICNILAQYSEDIGFKLPYKPEFGSFTPVGEKK